MNPNYLLLLLALIGLWTPSALFSPSSVKAKLSLPARRRNAGIGSLLSSKVNWIDLVRGGLCAWIIQNSVFHFENGQDELAHIFGFVQLAILAVAVFAQTVRISGKPCIIGPVFFLTGVTLAVSGPLVGGLTVALALTLALMLGRLSHLFLMAPLCLAVFSVVFGRLGLTTIFNAGLFGMPVFFSFAAGVRLSFVRRTQASKGPLPAARRMKLLRVAEEKKMSTPSLSAPVVQQRAA